MPAVQAYAVVPLITRTAILTFVLFIVTIVVFHKFSYMAATDIYRHVG
jgi:hypothetical protein